MLVPLETVGFFLRTFIIAQMFVRCDNEIFTKTSKKTRYRAERGILSFWMLAESDFMALERKQMLHITFT